MKNDIMIHCPGARQARAGPCPPYLETQIIYQQNHHTNSYTLNFISNIGLSIDYKGILNKIHTEKQ